MSTIAFSIIVTPQTGKQWTADVRQAEANGFAAVLLPDTLHTASPFPALAAAAAVTTTIKLRPWVLAAPMRHPAATARDTKALQLLSDGRFELGIGAGRPDAGAEADTLGMPWGSPGARRAQVAETVRVVQESVDPAPPVIVAAGGPRLLADAAEYADRIALAAKPEATQADLAVMVGNVHTGQRGNRRIPISYQLVGIGERLPYFTRTKFGHTPEALREAGAAGLLSGDVGEAVDQLHRLRSELGIEELLVPGELAEDFLPVLAKLA